MGFFESHAGNPYVIAELGINHGGSEGTARALISHAAAAQANAVKFQYRGARLLEKLDKPLEVGHELVIQDLERARLSPSEVTSLAKFAKALGLDVGVSFFDIADLDDFSNPYEIFDFFKIPSAELTNVELIRGLLGRIPLLISLGGHSETEVAGILAGLPSDAEWYPLHCVSNYPTLAHNARLGYITWLQQRWERPVGYSSHDDDFRRCATAAALGAVIIERHITLSKTAQGLDHTSSSDPLEFAQLVELLKATEESLSGNGPRVPNQGEILNMQNLGGCFHAVRDILPGAPIGRKDVRYRPPRIPGAATSPDQLPKMLPGGLRDGEAVPRNGSDLGRDIFLSDDLIDWARGRNIALPVRPHDARAIRSAIPLDCFEYHLSVGDLTDIAWTKEIEPTRRFSLHLPDYCSVDALMDPFSPNPETRDMSRLLMANAIDVTRALAETQHSDSPVPVVASFTSPTLTWDDFLARVAQLPSDFNEAGGLLTFQWLPPFAWYFGGSVPVDRLNSIKEFRDLHEIGVGLCFDVAHASMSCYQRQQDLESITADLLPLVDHVHISGASGVDGEGVDLVRADSSLTGVLPQLLNLPNSMKVLESWQGHLSGYRGFRGDLRFLYGASE